MEQLSVSYIPIKDITPYENNPRRNEDAVSKVADSIREFGWQQPIVVDGNNVIIVGHTRYKAALELGMTQVPVHVADGLTEEQVRAYRLVDNKTNEFAEWDFGKLQSELDGIEDIDMSGFGFLASQGGTGISYINDLMTEDFAKNPSAGDAETFTFSLVFPISCKESVEGYLEANGGRKGLVEKITKEAEKWA